MNMKKLMAVVLAVVLAISAMAVNVFAAEGEVVKIPLRPSDAVSTTNSRTYEYTFEFPIYGLYGYLTQDSYLELSLPTKFNASNANVVWSISTNLGNSVLISGQYWDSRFYAGAGYTDDYATIYVNIGTFDRAYVNDSNWATIRQGAFNELNTITLTATVTLTSYPGYDSTWSASACSGTDMYVQVWTAGDDGVKDYGSNDDVCITGSNLFSQNMSISKTDKGTSSTYGYYDFISDIEGLTAVAGEDGWDDTATVKTLDEADYWTDANGETRKDYKNVDLVWDMTLQNRAYIINAESARIVVKLYNASWNDNNALGFTNGLAVYSLYLADTPMSSSTVGQLWWQNGSAYNRVATRVAFQNVNNEKVTELSFEISPEQLYNATYGLSAGITSTFRIYAETETPVSSFWDYYGSYYNRNYDHFTDDAYIELTMPATDDGDEIDANEPVEADPGTDEVEDPDDLYVEEPSEEPEDTNPTTGIVLAVLPMVVAAAAVVASKRR